MRRVLVADISPASRSWLRAVMLLGPSRVSEVSTAWDLLDAVADGPPFDLIVASRQLPGMGGVEVLATLRTAGIDTPFLLIAPFCRDRLRSTVRKAGGAAVIEDVYDANAFHTAVHALLRDGRPREPELRGRRPLVEQSSDRLAHSR